MWSKNQVVDNFDNFLEWEICNSELDEWIDACKSMLSNRSPLRNLKKCDTSFRHIFITVSLPQDISISNVVSFDFDKLKLEADEASWSFEFHGQDLKYHPHLHMLVKIPKMKLDKQRIIKRFSKLFKVKPNFVDYRYGNTKYLYNKRYLYITGDKTDRKNDQVLADFKLRTKLNIKSYYYYTS